MELNRYIDHTLLKADATKDRIIKLCNEAKEHHFRTVCVNPCWISLCKELLAGSDVGVCCVIGFPLGANSTAAKAFEAKDAIKLGADEVDMVINIGKLIDNDLDYVINDIKACKEAVGDHVLKVIIETCLLSDEQKVTACKCIKEAKADEKVVALKSLETLSNVANGTATKIIVPSDLQNIATLGTTVKEMLKDNK